MNILSLNINGLGRGDYKSDWVCKLVQKHNIAVLGIQETKRKEITDIMARRMWGSSDFVHIEQYPFRKKPLHL